MSKTYTANELVKLGILRKIPRQHYREVNRGQYVSILEALSSPSTTDREIDYELEFTPAAEKALQPLLTKVGATGLADALAKLLNPPSASL